MSYWKSFGLAGFAVLCLLSETTGSARAQCSLAGNFCATEWSEGAVTELGGLPGTTLSEATSINNAGQVVGVSGDGIVTYATEWSGGSVINLGGLPGNQGSMPTASTTRDRR